MPKGGETAVRERMRALCQKITVAYDLDPEIQEELYGHMEDRLLGYMSGEDKLTEEDAYILVREHFGDPAALKGLLHEVHDASVRTTLARRLTAALVATVAVTALVSLATNAAVLGWGLWAAQNGAADTIWPVRFWSGAVSAFVATGMLWYVLARWQRQLAQGRKPWFVRWPGHWMWMASGAALVPHQVIPFVHVLVEPTSPPLPGMNPGIVAAFVLATNAVLLAQPCAWLWWSDRPPRARQGLAWTAFAWVSLLCYQHLFPRLMPAVVVGTTAPSGPGFASGEFAHGSFFGTPLQWWLVAKDSGYSYVLDRYGSSLYAFIQIIGVQMAYFALVGFAAWALYHAGRFVYAQVAKRSVNRRALAGF